MSDERPPQTIDLPIPPGKALVVDLCAGSAYVASAIGVGRGR